MSRRPNLSAEHGFTMTAVILVLLATSILAGAAFAAVGTDIPFARESQDRKQAYSAAEAGIEYYLYQLTRDNDYWMNCADVPESDDGQPAPVNLEDPAAEARKWRKLVGTEAKFSIELLPANGAPDCAEETAEETMLKEGSGAFRIRSTGVSRGVRRSIVTTLRRTSFLDFLYFTDFEASDPNSFATASQQNTARTLCVQYRAARNLHDWCKSNVNITFPTWDAIRGPMHTNDDLLTCGTPEFGRAGKEDVIEVTGPAEGGYTAADDCDGTPTFHGPVRQPADPLPVPTSNAGLKAAADEDYVFQGKTKIVFDGTSNMQVTRYPNNNPTTSSMPLPENGVIYVEKNGTCSLAAPRQIDYTVSNDYGCAILMVQGTYPKSMTLGSEDDILIDGDLVASNAKPVLGLIANRFVRVKHDVKDACGANNTNDSTGLPAHRVRQNYRIEAAILALKDSFVVDNYQCGNDLGTLTVFGAIAQKFRGPVGTFSGTSLNSGYTKDYNYNDALRYRSPPYFLDPLQAAWRVVRANEQVPAAE
jgi:type II secretory pathway pseudopilin PulG